MSLFFFLKKVVISSVKLALAFVFVISNDFAGPIHTTVSDMWRLIWQLKTNRVVMLTKLSDCGMVYSVL